MEIRTCEEYVLAELERLKAIEFDYSRVLAEKEYAEQKYRNLCKALRGNAVYVNLGATDEAINIAVLRSNTADYGKINSAIMSTNEEGK